MLLNYLSIALNPSTTTRSPLHTCNHHYLILFSKDVIESSEKFNFLRDCVSKVPELDKSKKDGGGSHGAKRKHKEKEKKVAAENEESKSAQGKR